MKPLTVEEVVQGNEKTVLATNGPVKLYIWLSINAGTYMLRYRVDLHYKMDDYFVDLERAIERYNELIKEHH